MRKKTINTTALGQMIKQAEREKMTPALILKLLKIYIGTDVAHLTNECGQFTSTCFNQLAIILKMKNSRELVNLVVRSKWFIIGKTPKGENSVYPIRWFASPLVIDEQELTMQMEVLRKTENPPFEPTVSVESELGFGSLWEDKGAGNLQGDFPWVNYIITSTGINHITLPGRQATLDALSEQGAQASKKPVKQT